MFSIKNIYHIIIAVVIYEIIRHFIGAIYINWNPKYENSDTQILTRKLYVFWEWIDSYIIAFFITKYSKNENMKIYSSRIKLIVTLILTKYLMIIILNTINPTNRIISFSEWMNKFGQIVIVLFFQITIGIAIFYFVKPKLIHSP